MSTPAQFDNGTTSGTVQSLITGPNSTTLFPEQYSLNNNNYTSTSSSPGVTTFINTATADFTSAAFPGTTSTYPTVDGGSLSGYPSGTVGGTFTLNNLLSGYILAIVQGSITTPTDWFSFEAGWKNWTQARTSGTSSGGDAFNNVSGEVPPDITVGLLPLYPLSDPSAPGSPNLYTGFLNIFLKSMGSGLDSSFPPQLTGDWSIFNGLGMYFSDAIAPSGINPFIAAFSDFLNTFSTNFPNFSSQFFGTNITQPSPNQFVVGDGLALPQGNQQNALTLFLQAFQKYLTQVVTIQPESTSNPNYPSGTVSNPPFTPSGTLSLSSYEAIWNAAHPIDTSNVTAVAARHAAFVAAARQFFSDQSLQDGYFLPSSSFSAWIQQVIIPVIPDHSSLSSNDSYKVIIINKILLLLIALIGAIQNMGIAQAHRLTFTSNFERAYTTLQTQIPVFLRGDFTIVGGTDSGQTNARNELNSSFNSFITQNLRNLGGLQDNAAKSQQSSLNQTNDAVNQQTDMVSTFIQQLSSLLSTILK